MKKTIVPALVILFTITRHIILAQGCSDPGICTSGTLNASNTQDSTSSLDFTEAGFEALLNTNIASEKYRIGLDFVYGDAEKGTTVYNLILRGSMRIKEKVLVNVKMPFAYISGPVGKTYGTGDLTFTLQNTFKSGKNMALAYTLGVIIPTNDGNLMYENRSMPMVYQSSLGLFSALAGLSYKYKKWSAVIGYQYSFGSNGNLFITDNIVLDTASTFFDPVNEKRAMYANSSNLQRGSDLIFRLERGFELKKIQIALGVLPIVRLTNSRFLTQNGTETEIMKSNGLTINVTAGISYFLTKNLFLRLNSGFPVLRRTTGPDGLLRDAVIILGVGVKIW